MIPRTLIPSIFTLFTLTSCAPTSEDVASAPAEKMTNSARPAVLKLIGAQYGSTLAELKWSGHVPSLKMNLEGEEPEWVEGQEVEHDVFQFGQNRYYQLILNFEHGAFIENGFDGGPLDTVTGSFKVVR